MFFFFSGPNTIIIIIIEVGEGSIIATIYQILVNALKKSYKKLNSSKLKTCQVPQCSLTKKDKLTCSAICRQTNKNPKRHKFFGESWSDKELP